MAKSTFNPNMQPDFVPMSDSAMSDPLDILGKATKEPYVSSLRDRVNELNANKTPDQLFWDNSARKDGYGVNDAQFRGKEIAKLKERIKSGQAGDSDIRGYTDAGGLFYKDGTEKNTAFMGNIFQNQVREQELAARVDQYIAIVKSGEAIDGEARKELMEMYRSGARSVDIAKKLKDASEGVGIYGDRKNNTEQAKLSFERRTGDSRMGIL